MNTAVVEKMHHKYKKIRKVLSIIKSSQVSKCTGNEKLIKMQDDLEEAQIQIRSLMGQLGQGMHWWGSFL